MSHGVNNLLTYLNKLIISLYNNELEELNDFTKTQVNNSTKYPLMGFDGKIMQNCLINAKNWQWTRGF